MPVNHAIDPFFQGVLDFWISGRRRTKHPTAGEAIRSIPSRVPTCVVNDRNEVRWAVRTNAGPSRFKDRDDAEADIAEN